MTDPAPAPHDPRPPTAFHRALAELRRRKVFRVVGVYGAVALVVIETADLVFPRIPLPEWTVSLVVWLALLGLPVAMVLAWAFEVTPDGVRRTEPASPVVLDSLARAPASSRWRGALFALAGLALLALGFYGGTRTGTDPAGPDAAAASGDEAAGPDSSDARPAIAVLPFADVSRDGDQRYFSDGVSEEILMALSRIRELRVAARSSAFSYRSDSLDARDIGDALAVPYLLSGSVRRAGERVRITAELVNADDGFRLWSESYERELTDIFAIQTEIATEIARALRVPLGLPPAELVSATQDPAAHDLYLAGRAALRRRGPGVREAIDLFDRAVARDSSWAPAWAGLAEAHAMVPLYASSLGESTDSAFWAKHLAAAEGAARRALELDPRNASARVALGTVHRDRWEWAMAEAELRKAIAADPDNGEAHVQYAELLWGMGRLAESLREARRALELDRTPVRLDIVGFVLYTSGRSADAEPYLLEGIRADPAADVHFLRTVYGRLLLFDGRYDEARRYAAFFPDSAAFRMQADALEARDPDLLPDDPSRVLPQTWQLLGDSERAFAALEGIIFRIPFRVPFQIWDPNLAPLRETDRFRRELLPRLNMAGARLQLPGPDA